MIKKRVYITKFHIMYFLVPLKKTKSRMSFIVSCVSMVSPYFTFTSESVCVKIYSVIKAPSSSISTSVPESLYFLVSDLSLVGSLVKYA